VAARTRKASNLFSERRVGVQARKLERVGNLDTGQPILSLTKRRGPAEAGSFQRRSWTEGTRPRGEGRENPEEQEAQEGSGSSGALTGFDDTALTVGSKALKSRVGWLAPGGSNLLAGPFAQRHEGIGGGNPVRLRGEGQTPGGRTLDVAAG